MVRQLLAVYITIKCAAMNIFLYCCRSSALASFRPELSCSASCVLPLSHLPRLWCLPRLFCLLLTLCGTYSAEAIAANAQAPSAQAPAAQASCDERQTVALQKNVDLHRDRLEQALLEQALRQARPLSELNSLRQELAEGLWLLGSYESSAELVQKAVALLNVVLADMDAVTDSERRSVVRYWLAWYLQSLGHIEKNAAHFAEAAGIYREDLADEAFWRGLDKRRIHHMCFFAEALESWGEYEPQPEKATALLEEAVDMYRRTAAEAKEYRRKHKPENVPLHEQEDGWGQLQRRALCGLSSTLKSLSERESGELGMQCLKKAIAAQRAALKLKVIHDSVVGKAEMRDTLGVLLRLQGEREAGVTSGRASGRKKGMALLNEAVVEHKAALAAFTREKKYFGREIAQCQANLKVTTEALLRLTKPRKP